MNRLFFVLIPFWFSLTVFSQEKPTMDLISVPLIKAEKPDPGISMFSDVSWSAGELSFRDHSVFKQPFLPAFDFNRDLKKYLLLPGTSVSNMLFYNGLSPFFSKGIVFNYASYKLNDRFSFGGSSFGAQSVFDKPTINPSVQNMGTKGASVFLQYKVSKNFKIETQVSISNHQSPW